MRFNDMSRMKAILLFVAALAFAAAPLFSPSFAGYEPGDFPIPVEDPAIQPASYAFSIWLLIYGWLIAHAGFGLLKRDEDVAWDAVRWPLMGSLILGIAWLQVASLNPVIATVVIWAMLGLALSAVFRAPSIPDRWLLLAPLAVYAGWLNAAAAVSLGVVLQGWGVLGGTASAAAMLAVVLALALTVQATLRRAPEYGGAVIWALIGVMVANLVSAPTVALLAGLGIAVMATGTWRVARERSPFNPS
ncbi:hypothetical protein DEA8626_01098 [Defluviimonas aquaemixtae]|uniref:Tryptophan-rich sensory protein n=1 Tax=Albidovulum aquaemixtae TaxID=1542388 RepID=A0A2R8B4M7_9RHOB|nr:hypothetical protein [Defluviimonas aquaemixtae]SPH17575.1 hypothetical protein DEA8626_01098 [Defluviimonas aquaemixtae]